MVIPLHICCLQMIPFYSLGKMVSLWVISRGSMTGIVPSLVKVLIQLSLIYTAPQTCQGQTKRLLLDPCKLTQFKILPNTQVYISNSRGEEWLTLVYQWKSSIQNSKVRRQSCFHKLEEPPSSNLSFSLYPCTPSLASECLRIFATKWML